MYRKNKNSWTKHMDFMILDIICLQVSFFLAYVIRHRSMHMFSNLIYSNLAIVLCFVDVVVLLALNTLKNVLKRGYLKEFIATVRQVSMVSLIAVLYLFSVKDAEGFSRITFFLMALLYVLVSYVLRILWKRLVLHRIKLRQQKSMLIITDMDDLPRVERDIREQEYAMFQLSGIAVLDLENETAGGQAELGFNDITAHRVAVGDKIHGIPIVAGRKNMTEYICREWVDEVFIDLQVKNPFMDVLVNQLIEMGVTIHIKLAERFELNSQKQFVEKMGKYTVLTTSLTAASGGKLFLKRMIDIAGGLVGCAITGVLFIFLAPAICTQSPGPVFFVQTRVGMNGKRFKLYKFRSMYRDAEKRKSELMNDNRVDDGMMFKLEYDPRIIGCKKLPDGTVKKGIGNWMRDWSIDEFPQFWNVLKGDMSLVGTRPPTEDEWEKYELHHRSRLAIKPGITGMWQVSGRSNITEFEKVVELDRYYITNWDLALDFKILGKTIPAVFKRDGAM